MKKSFYIIFVLSLVFLHACRENKPKLTAVTKVNTEKPVQMAPNRQNNGPVMLNRYCSACHAIMPGHGKGMKEMKAPPFMGVRMHYLRRYPDREEFVRAVATWVKHPDSSKSLMPGAIRRFGLMPALPYPDDTLKKIALELYHLSPAQTPGTRCGNGKCGGKCGGNGRCGR